MTKATRRAVFIVCRDDIEIPNPIPNTCLCHIGSAKYIDGRWELDYCDKGAVGKMKAILVMEPGHLREVWVREIINCLCEPVCLSKKLPPTMDCNSHFWYELTQTQFLGIKTMLEESAAARLDDEDAFWADIGAVQYDKSVRKWRFVEDYDHEAYIVRNKA